MDETNTPQGTGSPAGTQLSDRELLGIELDILRYPNPLLKKPTEPVTTFDEELASFVEKLYGAMRAHDGVAAATPGWALRERWLCWPLFRCGLGRNPRQRSNFTGNRS